MYPMICPTGASTWTSIWQQRQQAQQPRVLAQHLKSRTTRITSFTQSHHAQSSTTLRPIGNESVPIQLAQCRFPGLAISDAKILTYFSNKIHGSNFIKQHSKLLRFEITKMPIAV